MSGDGCLNIIAWMIIGCAIAFWVVILAKLWTFVLGVDLLVAVSNFIWPKKEKA